MRTPQPDWFDEEPVRSARNLDPNYKIRQTVQMMPAHMPLLIDTASIQGRGEE
jgi:hypothetical protein